MVLVDQKAWIDFLQRCAREGLGAYRKVYAPAYRGGSTPDRLFLASILEQRSFVFDAPRATDPLKVFLYQPRARVLPDAAQAGRQIVAGVKACDIRALQVLDAALLQPGRSDPVYRQWRAATTVVSADCADVAATCHCTLVGGAPFAASGFDVNLSTIDGRYLVTAASERGRLLVSLLGRHAEVEEATEDDLAAVRHQRDTLYARVANQNSDHGSARIGLPLRRQADDYWLEHAEGCVGCGACTNICPTCHCFILNDESTSSGFTKVRSYDSCQLCGYTRVAGEGTPRPGLAHRFRHRYACKFNQMDRDFGLLGCTGCGRCIDACPAGIDIRTVAADMSAPEAEVA